MRLLTVHALICDHDEECPYCRYWADTAGVWAPYKHSCPYPNSCFCKAPKNWVFAYEVKFVHKLMKNQPEVFPVAPSNRRKEIVK